MQTNNRFLQGFLAGSAMLIVLGAVPCFADELRGELAECREIAADSVRLACFDRIAGGVVSLKPTGAAPVTAAAEPAAVTVVPAAAPVSAAATVGGGGAATLDGQEKFGLNEREIAAKEVAAGTRPVDAEKIQARIVGMQQAPDGHVVFTFDNGQAWRQLLPEGDMLARLGDQVVISRALFGSYWLELRSKRGCKVTRVR